MRALALAALLCLAAAPAHAADPVDALALLQAGAVAAPVPMTPDAMQGSEDAGARLTFASILFYQAGYELGTDAKKGEALFADVERELTEAVRLSGADTDERRRNVIRAQAAFLLGELAWHVHHDTARADQFYAQALRYVPDHAAAAAARKNLAAAH